MTTILFDLDGTLCDYDGAKTRALDAIAEMLTPTNIPHDEYLKAYNRIEPVLFRKFIDGDIKREDYRVERFAAPLRELGVADGETAKSFNKVYLDIANLTSVLFRDAIPTLRRLRKNALQLGILTNGPSDGQRRKLQNNSLDDLIDGCFISEEIGAAKPDPRAFLFAARAMNREPGQIVFVGDSLEDDVDAANAVGMKGILLDRQNVRPTYEGARLRNLHELFGLLSADPSRQTAQ